MELAIGNLIRWKSAAGELKGIITNITLSKAASGKITPWIDISLGDHNVRLCGTHDYLKMMRVVKES